MSAAHYNAIVFLVLLWLFSLFQLVADIIKKP